MNFGYDLGGHLNFKLARLSKQSQVINDFVSSYLWFPTGLQGVQIQLTIILIEILTVIYNINYLHIVIILYC